MTKLCIGIPNYNHGTTIDSLLTQLAHYQLPCILVDDGSNIATKSLLNTAANTFDWVTLITLPNNLGKGGAMQAALTYAEAQGYTHLLQIDADGQHDSGDIPRLLEEHTKHPDALITGVPVYDASVPRSRLYGRQITRLWVMIETLSTQIQDAMCGFRLYPIAPAMAIIRHQKVGLRMDFDIAILVRLFWQGTMIISIPTKVSYPINGISHFHLWRDNVIITCMHTRLFFGMLRRLPRLLKPIFCKMTARLSELWPRKKTQTSWHQLQERGTQVGILFMLYCYRLLGIRVTYGLLYPITFYFYLFNKTARRASKDYLAHIQNITQPNPGTHQGRPYKRRNKHLARHALNHTLPTQAEQSQAVSTENPTQTNGSTCKLSSFRHLLSFSQAIVDKLAVWNGDINLNHITFHGQDLLNTLIASKRGGVIFTAHLGNMEIARALSRFIPELRVNALVFNRHAIHVNHVLSKVNKDYRFNMIEVQTLDIPLAIQLQEKIEAGELIVIAADRTSTAAPNRSLCVSFLNQSANLPEGAFILASILKCPSYLMLCLKERHLQFRLCLTQLFDEMPIDRANRQKSLTDYAQCYADRLADYCHHYPLQWFNFFDFWCDAKNNNTSRKNV